MPELPEVETVARQLRDREPRLLGRTIMGAEVRWARTVATHPPEYFTTQLTGSRVIEVSRHGKTLVIALTQGDALVPRFLLVHLRMSGRLDVVPNIAADTKHARVIIHLDNQLALRFDDARKFGRMWLVDHPSMVLADNGPDALAVSQQDFVNRLKAKKGMVKSILLDQTFVAGIGNIYADESLFHAGIRPTRLASKISRAEAARLHGVVREVLHEGIKANGATFDWVYPDGSFQESFRVYGRTGKPCVSCGAPIKRILVGQRSTHYCATCQK